MSDPTPQHREFDSAVEISAALRDAAAQFVAEFDRIKALEELAPDVFAVKSVELMSRLRDQADRWTRVGVEFAAGRYGHSGRQLALAAGVSNSTVARWLSDPVMIDRAALDVAAHEARQQ